MNNRELRVAVRDRNGIPDAGDGLAGHTDIDAAIAAALRDISAESMWPWLLTSTALSISTTTGRSTDAPSLAQIHKLVVNAAVADYVPLGEFIQGTRRWVWTNVGTQVQLSPTPTVAPTCELWYWQVEPDLTTDTASPLLPAVYHQTLVARASYHLNRRRPGKAAELAADLAEYASGVKNMMLAKERTSTPHRIRDAYRAGNTSARWS